MAAELTLGVRGEQGWRCCCFWTWQWWTNNRMLLICRTHLASQKNGPWCPCFLPSTTTPVLSPPSAFFSVLFYSGLVGHVRIPARYLLNRDYDLSMILHTHLLTVNFCLDSGTYFFNLLRIAVSFSDVFATIALWLWNEFQRTLVGRR